MPGTVLGIEETGLSETEKDLSSNFDHFPAFHILLPQRGRDEVPMNGSRRVVPFIKEYPFLVQHRLRLIQKRTASPCWLKEKEEINWKGPFAWNILKVLKRDRCGQSWRTAWQMPRNLQRSDTLFWVPLAEDPQGEHIYHHPYQPKPLDGVDMILEGPSGDSWKVDLHPPEVQEFTVEHG